MSVTKISATFCASLAVALFATATHAGDCPLSSGHTTPVVYEAKSADKAEKKDIVDTAVEAGSFKTLVTAVKAAGLVETLKGKGPFTVFAPTDEAFAKLPKGTVEELLKPENKKKLTEILTYHVVPGKVTAAQAMKVDEAKTVQGSKISIKTKDDKVMIDEATVVKADIMTSNGVIHVIDAVIMP